MKTIKGYKIKNFKKLKTPIDRNNLEPHIYEGIVIGAPVHVDSPKDGAVDFRVSWDKFGRCSNPLRDDCYIDPDKIPVKERIEKPTKK